MLTIIDYKVGNLFSIKNMLERIGCTDIVISDRVEDIEAATKLILPGVGHFDYGMARLRSAPYFDKLDQKVHEGQVPILGICLGAQLLLDGSEEGQAAGLGWIGGRSRKFDESRLPHGFKIPHMGWGEVTPLRPSRLLENLPEDARYYFVHTYHMECTNADHHILSSVYGYPFVAGIEKDNIVGVQFHPEKSHKYGLALLRNFITNY